MVNDVVRKPRPKPPAAGMGKEKGKQNKVTTTLKEAILLAAAQTGSDKNGKEGLLGYLKMVAKQDVKSFTGLLGKVLPQEMMLSGDRGLIVRIVRDGIEIEAQSEKFAGRLVAEQAPREPISARIEAPIEAKPAPVEPIVEPISAADAFEADCRRLDDEVGCQVKRDQ